MSALFPKDKSLRDQYSFTESHRQSTDLTCARIMVDDIIVLVKDMSDYFWDMAGKPNCASGFKHHYFALSSGASRALLSLCNSAFGTEVLDLFICRHALLLATFLGRERSPQSTTTATAESPERIRSTSRGQSAGS